VSKQYFEGRVVIGPRGDMIAIEDFAPSALTEEEITQRLMDIFKNMSNKSNGRYIIWAISPTGYIIPQKFFVDARPKNVIDEAKIIFKRRKCKVVAMELDEEGDPIDLLWESPDLEER